MSAAQLQGWSDAHDRLLGRALAAELQVEKLKAAVAEMDKLAEAGMCYFAAPTKHLFLKDIRRAAKKAGVQGGLTEFTE